MDRERAPPTPPRPNGEHEPPRHTPTVDRSGAEPVLTFRGDSDAHIVRGLVCLMLTIYSHRPAREIVETDAMDVFQQLGLTAHLTPQRSNGVRSMVERIKHDARQALSPA